MSKKVKPKKRRERVTHHDNTDNVTNRRKIEEAFFNSSHGLQRQKALVSTNKQPRFQSKLGIIQKANDEEKTAALIKELGKVLSVNDITDLGEATATKVGKKIPKKSADQYAHNMIENPGPLASLADNPAANFAGGKYNMTILNEDLILYRAGEAGGGRHALGQWFTRKPVDSVAQVRIDLAVKPQWKDVNGMLTGSSPIESVYQIKVPRGTTIYEGPVGNQGDIYLGGQNVMQIYINQPWNIKGLQVMGELPIGHN